MNINLAAPRVSLSGFWLILIAAVLWGTSGAVIKVIYASDAASPLGVSLMRLAIATPVLALSCWKLLGRRTFAIERRDLALMVVSGFCIAWSHTAYFAAIPYVGVTVATLVTICTAPIIVVGISTLLKQEQLTRRVFAALACALVGTVALVGLQSDIELPQRSAVGVLFALGSAVGYAGMIVGGRFLAQRYHSLQITTMQFSAGTLVSLTFNLLAGTQFSFSFASWTLLLYLGIMTTAVAYGLFLAGMKTTSGTTASILTVAEPLTAAVIAWMLFGERLGVSALVGACLLVLSFVILAYNDIT